MKKNFLISFLVIVFLTSDIALSQISTFTVNMSPQDYFTMYTRNYHIKDYLDCSFQFGNYLELGAGIRIKGSTTRYYNKKSFRVKFPGSNLFQGNKQLNLNSEYTDKTFINNKMCYEIFKEIGAFAPVAYYFIWLNINNVEKGFYTAIEKIDKYFYVRHNRPEGPTYEAEANYGLADLTIQPVNLLKLYYTKEVGDTNDYRDLAMMIDTLNLTPEAQFPSMIQRLFDISTVINWLAINSITQMGDTYRTNYYLYRDTTKTTSQWHILPWDYDLSFGRDGRGNIPYPNSLLNDYFSYTYSVCTGPSNVLKDRILANPVTKEMLRVRIKNILDSVFTEERMNNKIDSLSSIIAPYVPLDPLKWGTVDDFYEQLDSRKYFVMAKRNYLYRRFINPNFGEYHEATVPVSQLNVPYRFVDYAGNTIGSMWFSSFSGLDSIKLKEYHDVVPPNLPNPNNMKYVKKYFKITTYPSNAQYTAKIQLEYFDYQSDQTEVMSGVQNERLLKGHCYINNQWNIYHSSVNSFTNTVTIYSIDQSFTGNTIAFFVPDSYPQNWFRASNYDWQRYHDIGFINSQTGYITGEQGIFAKTTNAGTNWTSMEIVQNMAMYSLAAIGNTVYTAGEHGSFYRSSNNGSNWTKLTTNTYKKLNCLVALSASDVWAVGDSGIVLHSTNSGTNFSTSYINSNYNINSFVNLSPSEFIGVGNKGKIFRTTNAGVNWTIDSLNTQKNILSVRKLSNSFLGIAGDKGLVMYSNNKGINWNYIGTDTNLFLTDISIIDSSRMYVCSGAGRIHYTLNRGLSWHYQYSADEHDLYAICFTDSTHGYAVGSDATLLKTNTAGTVNLNNNNLVLPVTYKLNQNYPNPFNPVTMITYELPRNTFVKLKIYNILGREVVSLVNNIKEAGIHKIQWNASAFPSGIYFCLLSVDNYIEARKLVLLK